jgi:hypothetical protein
MAQGILRGLAIAAVIGACPATGQAAPPTVDVVASGSSAVPWAASVMFTTMGLIVDGNSNVQQLYSVNANPASPNSTPK